MTSNLWGNEKGHELNHLVGLVFFVSRQVINSSGTSSRDLRCSGRHALPWDADGNAKVQRVLKGQGLVLKYWEQSPLRIPFGDPSMQGFDYSSGLE